MFLLYAMYDKSNKELKDICPETMGYIFDDYRVE